jgi:hypothetical protein
MSGFDKWIPSAITEYEIYHPQSTDELHKVASVDLPEDFMYDPDYLYLWVRIVSAGEYYGPNKNGDYFPEQELMDYYHTFRNAHPFKNHENKKVENAIGQVLDVRWNPVMKCVEIFKGIDKKRAPEIVRGFLKGYLTDVSMGCKVPYTICSVCGNKAKKRSEFCVHVNKYRMQYLANGERVFEVNYEPSFHDSSVVLSGAERVAKALMIIDNPPTASVSFKKVATSRGVDRFIRLTDNELEKVASARQAMHPFFIEPIMDKLAYDNDLIQKLAEIEKEITGKVLNVVSAPDEEERDAASNVISIIKFLTEKRMDEETVSSIAETIKNLAESEKLSISRVFSTFLGIAELLGIELYPNELHNLLREITDAKLNPELETSEPIRSSLTPSDVSIGSKQIKVIMKKIPNLTDSSELHNLYDDAAHDAESFLHQPSSFLNAVDNEHDWDTEPNKKVVKVIRMTLSPMMSLRSHLPQHLLPRIMPFLEGMVNLSGNRKSIRDFDMISNPRSLGDLLGSLSYNNYQNMRPVIVRTKMIRLAKLQDSGIEKIASSVYPEYQEVDTMRYKYATLNELPGLLKEAESFPVGSFSALNADMLAKFAHETKLPSEKVAVIKTATLLDFAGMQKTANELLEQHELPASSKGLLLKSAMRFASNEMEKMANDYAVNLLADSTFLPNSISTTIPGRLVDAFVFTKLTRALNEKMGGPKPSQNMDMPKMPNVERGN